MSENNNPIAAPLSRRATLLAALAASAGSAGLAQSALAAADALDGAFVCRTPRAPDTTLYVWAGDVKRQSRDFIAVIEFDENSPRYGKVIRLVEAPTSNNEAHHVGLSADGKTLIAGGLLSLLQGQDDMFLFDVSTPRFPRFVRSTSAPLSAVTDDFVPLPNGGFLATNMGSKNGDAPGRVVELDAKGNVVHEWPDNPPADGFNPHGISVREDLNLMITSDFLNPITSINAAGRPMAFRNTVRVWDLKTRTIVRSIPIPGAVGTMDVKLIPQDPKGRAYTAGVGDGRIYLVNTKSGTAQAVFDTRWVSLSRTARQPQILALSEDGTRMILPLGGAGLVVMLNIERPETPYPVSVVDLGPNAGPHMAHLTHDNKRLVVSNYFLDQDNFGKVHFDGDRHVRVLKVSRKGMWLDRRFDVDMNKVSPNGPARPHGIAAK